MSQEQQEKIDMEEAFIAVFSLKRLQILKALQAEPMFFTKLVSVAGIDRHNIKWHLAILEKYHVIRKSYIPKRLKQRRVFAFYSFDQSVFVELVAKVYYYYFSEITRLTLNTIIVDSGVQHRFEKAYKDLSRNQTYLRKVERLTQEASALAELSQKELSSILRSIEKT